MKKKLLTIGALSLILGVETVYATISKSVEEKRINMDQSGYQNSVYYDDTYHHEQYYTNCSNCNRNNPCESYESRYHKGINSHHHSRHH